MAKMGFKNVHIPIFDKHSKSPPETPLKPPKTPLRPPGPPSNLKSDLILIIYGQNVIQKRAYTYI